MTIMHIHGSNGRKDNKSNDLSKSDPETLHTPDPQDHMEGPVSSMVQEMKESWEKASEDDTTGNRNEGDREEEAE